MRISDWSSDVCSSDLPPRSAACSGCAGLASKAAVLRSQGRAEASLPTLFGLYCTGEAGLAGPPPAPWQRSEERGVGKEGVETVRSGWSAYHTNTKKSNM